MINPLTIATREEAALRRAEKKWEASSVTERMGVRRVKFPVAMPALLNKPRLRERCGPSQSTSQPPPSNRLDMALALHGQSISIAWVDTNIYLMFTRLMVFRD